MKFYVASKFQNKEEVRKLFEKLEEKGHEITVDWTLHKPVKPYANNPEISKEYSLEDIEGVRNADVFVLLNCGGTGAHVELGVAIQSYLEKGKPIVYVVGTEESMMYYHPAVKMVKTIDEILQ